ncbi:GSCOCG00009885001-RA-CDS [Cotesia congregata]|nr:GSCOCG00009885001-RA-CDS [Cotesia congregata]
MTSLNEKQDIEKLRRELEEALKAYNSRVAEEKQNVPSQLQLQPVIPTKQSQDLTAAGSGETETAKPKTTRGKAGGVQRRLYRLKFLERGRGGRGQGWRGNRGADYNFFY